MMTCGRRPALRKDEGLRVRQDWSDCSSVIDMSCPNNCQKTEIGHNLSLLPSIPVSHLSPRSTSHNDEDFLSRPCAGRCVPRCYDRLCPTTSSPKHIRSCCCVEDPDQHVRRRRWRAEETYSGQRARRLLCNVSRPTRCDFCKPSAKTF